MLRFFTLCLAFYIVYGTDTCNWENSKSFSEVFEGNKIKCKSTGWWPEHSRPPCDINDNGLGGVFRVLATDCHPKLENRSKIMCKSQINWHSKKEATRIDIIKETLDCKCQDNIIISNSCTWNLDMQFKLGKHDSPEMGVFGIMCFLILTILFILPICSLDGFGPGLLLGICLGGDDDYDGEYTSYGYGTT